MKYKPLPKAQLETYNIIKSYKESFDISPTYQEIATARGITRTAVSGSIVALEKKGYIKHIRKSGRSLQIIKDYTL